MSDPIFGVVIRTVDNEARQALAPDLSTIGIIGPAPDADAATFPLDTPVKVYSNDVAKLKKLGEAGYLADAIRGVNDQLGETQFAGVLVIVRTAPGTNVDPALKVQETIAKVMGSSTLGTGLYAFLQSADLLGVTPRLIIAPGYTGQMANGISVITLDEEGAGYDPAHPPAVTISGGGNGATIVQATAHALVGDDGKLTGIAIDTPGQWYTGVPDVAIAAPPNDNVRATAHSTLGADADADKVATVVLDNPGVGYDPDNLPAITFAGGGGEVQATGHAVVNVDGELTSIVVDTAGSGYETPPTVTVAVPPADGTPATATAEIEQLANPVCASLPGVLSQLLGHAIVESSGLSEQADDDWRETLNSPRLIGLSGGCKVIDPTTGFVVVRPLAPRIAGIGMKRDHLKGAPFHSWANQPIYGIVGPGRALKFSITDGANEAQQLLAANLGVVVRGQVGNDFAISSGGFVFIGTDNMGDDPLWQFYNVSRGRDYIHLWVIRSIKTYLGRENITGHTIQAVINTIDGILSNLRADDHILGYRTSFAAAQNSADEFRLGHLTVAFAAEEPPVLRKITTESSRYRPAIDALVSSLEAQLSIAA